MMTRSPICLNMIVKNETAVLGRLFESVKDIIDYYVIVDTGSKDGTPEFIRQQMHRLGIEGEVIIEPWVNFGFNRNLALKYACQRRKHGWILFIDADEELVFNDSNFFYSLQPGMTYCLNKHHGNTRYSLPNLIDISRNSWRWQGVVHEYLEHINGDNQREVLDSAWIIYHSGEGARSRGLSNEQKFLRDAKLLEDELRKNPDDARSQFYLAQSYRDAGNLESAYQHYLKRAEMPGWTEETFFAQYQAAEIAKKLNLPFAQVVEAFLTAFQMHPTRSESLHGLAQYCREQKKFNLAYLFVKQGLCIPYPKDILFVDPSVYQWKLLDELAVASYWVGKFKESRRACEDILQKHSLGEIVLENEDLERIQTNLKFAVAKT